ncbi:conserved hypothetical protein [Burkholderia pseudomallei MSHR346]|nr:conserved hypothetical protein [Burkholderia pseudomallei MSHR346]
MRRLAAAARGPVRHLIGAMPRIAIGLPESMPMPISSGIAVSLSNPPMKRRARTRAAASAGSPRRSKRWPARRRRACCSARACRAHRGARRSSARCRSRGASAK